MQLQKIILIFLSIFLIHNISFAQDPHVRPSLEARELATNDQAIIPQRFMVLTNANVVDIRSGNILRGVTIVLKDGKILSVGTDTPPADAEVIDLRGYYVTLGLFEGHFHESSAGDAQRALVSGVTAAKGASINGFMDVALSDMVKAGYLAGPDIMPAGVYVTPIEALQAATIKSAEAYGFADKTGVIEAGLEANLTIFDRDPLLQPSVMYNPLAVISNGRIGLDRHAGDRNVLSAQ